MSNPPCVILSEVRSSNTPLCHPERSAKFEYPLVSS